MATTLIPSVGSFIAFLLLLLLLYTEETIGQSVFVTGTTSNAKILPTTTTTAQATTTSTTTTPTTTTTTTTTAKTTVAADETTSGETTITTAIMTTSSITDSPPLDGVADQSTTTERIEMETITAGEVSNEIATTTKSILVVVRGLRCNNKSDPNFPKPSYCNYNSKQMLVTRDRDGSGFDLVLAAAFDGLDVNLLNLIGLSLKSLDPAAFKGLGSLNSLYLGNNDIEVLPHGIFDDLTDLSFLYLDFNKIAKLNADLFNSPKYAIEISLSNNAISTIEDGVFDTINYLEKLHLNRNFLNSSSLNENTFKGLTSLEQLDLGHNEINSISSKMFEPMGRLNKLNMTENSLTYVPAFFISSPALKTIDLSFNKISDLDNNTFKDKVQLSEIRLNDNLISQIKRETFDSLYGMTTIHLENNRISNLESNTLSGLTQLETLILRNNSIRSLPLGWLDALGNLETVDLSHNLIDEVLLKPFETPYRLKNLDLSFNRLRSIGSEWFATNAELKELNLRGNQLSSFPEGIFQIPTQLSVIDFGCNLFKQQALENIFKNLTFLRVLRLDNNSMTAFDADMAGCQVLLEELHLNASCMKSVRVDGFSNLKKLHLQGNYLQSIGAEDLKDLTGLESLDASDNNIDSFDFGSFDKSVNLLFVNLSMNLIKDVTSRSKIPMNFTRATIDLSWNSISNFSTFPNVQKFYITTESYLQCSCDQLPNWKSAESFGSYGNTVCTAGSGELHFLACYLTNSSFCPSRPSISSPSLRDWCAKSTPSKNLTSRPVIYKESCGYTRPVIVSFDLNLTSHGVRITWNVTSVNNSKGISIAWQQTSESGELILRGGDYREKSEDPNYSISLTNSGSTTVCITTLPVYNFIQKSEVCKTINFTAPIVSSSDNVTRTTIGQVTLQSSSSKEPPFWAWIILAFGLLLLLLVLIAIVIICLAVRRRKEEKLREEEEMRRKSYMQREPSFRSSFTDPDLPYDTAEQTVISMDMYTPSL